MSASTTVTVTVTAPNSGNAERWAQILVDLIHAEHGDQMRLETHIGPVLAVEPFPAIAAAIRQFDFGFYGLEDVDPVGPHAQWVGDLASEIAGVLGAGHPAP